MLMLVSTAKFFSVSLGTFIKHLPLTFHSPKIKPRSFCSSRVKASCFDTLGSRQKEQIHLYVDALLLWNQKMNLTAVKERDQVMERHVEDSLALIPPIQDSYVAHCGTSCTDITVVDVGTGAGLPGLILAIACPGWKVTLLESLNKRCVFLEHAIAVSGLSNAQVVRGRAENMGQDDLYREQFDVAIARAVADMRILAEYCLPLVRVGGLFIAAKGHDPQEEVRNAEKAIQLMGASTLKLYPVESHSPFGKRSAIVCLKDHPTPKKYPRDPVMDYPCTTAFASEFRR